MGYLIDKSFIEKKTVIIPQADVQIMDTVRYPLISTTPGTIFIPIACHIMLMNQTTPYTGFNHIHLTCSQTFSVGELCATYAANAGPSVDLDASYTYSMLCNFQTSTLPPVNRFGATNGALGLEMFFDAPVVGDGDMIVNVLFYRIVL